MMGWDGNLLYPILLIGVPMLFLYYFWIAKDEMRGKPKIKRIIWLVPIPILLIFFFTCPFYTMLALIVLVALGEASECQ